MTARQPPTRDLITELLDRVETLERDNKDVKRKLEEIKIILEAVAVVRSGGYFISWLGKLLFSLAMLVVVWKAGLLGLLGVHHFPD